MAEFGKNLAPMNILTTEREVPRRSFIKQLSPGKSRPNNIVAFGTCEDADDNSS